MKKISKHLIIENSSIRQALEALNRINKNMNLFVIDKKHHLLGSITDGDIRRSLLKGYKLESSINEIMFNKCKYLYYYKINVNEIKKIRDLGISMVPLLNNEREIVDILDLSEKKSYIPADVIIMAGGRGERLKPFTDKCPKPLLTIKNKPILGHNLDYLISYGFKNFYICIRYLGEQIEKYINLNYKGIANFHFIREKEPLGTIGAASKIQNFKQKHVLILNADTITNLDYEDFFLHYLNKNADLAIASVPYNMNIPYAVMNIKGNLVKGLQEKPVYTYKFNAGIYFCKKENIKLIPKNIFFNATDLIEKSIKRGKKVIHYQITGYWIDIGRPEDLKKVKDFFEHR